MRHPIDCTSCPHCDPEMAAIMRDHVAGRWKSLANRMDAITHRTLRALGAKTTHPAYRVLRSPAVKSPTTEDFISAIDMFRNSSRPLSDSPLDHLAAVLRAGLSAPTTTTHHATPPNTVPAAQDLGAAIRAARREQSRA